MSVEDIIENDANDSRWTPRNENQGVDLHAIFHSKSFGHGHREESHDAVVDQVAQNQNAKVCPLIIFGWIAEERNDDVEEHQVVKDLLKSNSIVCFTDQYSKGHLNK